MSFASQESRRSGWNQTRRVTLLLRTYGNPIRKFLKMLLQVASDFDRSALMKPQEFSTIIRA
jgi:hypothetical protein